MTDTIEQKALALVNEVCRERGEKTLTSFHTLANHRFIEALCRAIEQHEAFQQEVSDAVEAALSVFNQLVLDDRGEAALRGARLVFARFIIAKPDPLVEALRETYNDDSSKGDADAFRAAIEKRGGKIVWGEG